MSSKSSLIVKIIVFMTNRVIRGNSWQVPFQYIIQTRLDSKSRLSFFSTFSFATIRRPLTPFANVQIEWYSMYEISVRSHNWLMIFPNVNWRNCAKNKKRATFDPLGNFREILTLLGSWILAGISIIKRYDYSFATFHVYREREPFNPKF